MKYALISEEQIKQVQEALEPVKASFAAQAVLEIIQSLKPSDPVAWKKTIDGSEITRSAKVAADLDFPVGLFPLEQSK
jgi:hypothetical protein